MGTIDSAIDTLRVKGLDKEASLLKIQLDLAQRIRDINQDDLLTEQEKAKLRDQAVFRAEDLAGATEERYRIDAENEARSVRSSGNAPTLGSGLYSQSLAAAVFGGPSASPRDDRIAKAQAEANKKLEENRKLLADIGRGIAELNRSVAE